LRLARGGAALPPSDGFPGVARLIMKWTASPRTNLIVRKIPTAIAARRNDMPQAQLMMNAPTSPEATQPARMPGIPGRAASAANPATPIKRALPIIGHQPGNSSSSITAMINPMMAASSNSINMSARP